MELIHKFIYWTQQNNFWWFTTWYALDIILFIMIFKSIRQTKRLRKDVSVYSKLDTHNNQEVIYNALMLNMLLKFYGIFVCIQFNGQTWSYSIDDYSGKIFINGPECFNYGFKDYDEALTAGTIKVLDKLKLPHRV